ncbi:MAG: DUF4831 family protein [Bacteroidales bacterium]|nr:DUF4831 family protein [Bacteroidales bacterium]
MNRQIFILLTLLTLVTAGCSVFTGKSADDTKVLPLGDSVPLTDGSLVYALPLTVLEFEIIAVKRTEVPGPFAAHAGDMIGLDRVITAENESWSLTDVRLNTVEELDPSKFYIIQGTTLMQTNMLALRKSGLVLDINPEVYGRTAHSGLTDGSDYSGLLFPDRGAYEYVSTRTDTAYRVVKADTAFIRVPYLVQRKKGMTLEEEAREAADRLMELREGRHMILTGETNIFPQDGAAIDEINRLEREYTALFAGKSWTETKHFRFWVTPDLAMAGKKTVLFSFSETMGLTESPEGPGRPVVMEIVPSGKTRELNLVVRPVTSQKDLALTDRLYYRVPDVAEITVTLGDEKLCTARKLIYQFGNTVALPANFIIGR